MIPGSQVSALTTGNITLAGAKGAFNSWSGPEGGYDVLTSVTVGSSSVSSIDFVGIPAGYKHLQLLSVARNSRSASAMSATAVMRFN